MIEPEAVRNGRAIGTTTGRARTREIVSAPTVQPHHGNPLLPLKRG
ncbi:hypothetical protein Hesp01_20330 [Herbidospora sp. NBRC 101105]|nr:hypothetical protein Hesp01_20330 [Herbidospora sp. NBRC 101105]